MANLSPLANLSFLPGLAGLAGLIDRFNRRVGQTVAWLSVIMIAVQFTVVMMHYVFGVGSIFAQESIVYMHGVLFMGAAGYTLLRDGHVRVDIFYASATPKARSIVDVAGAVTMLIPVCILVWWTAWPYVMASWAVFEGSRETSGIQAVFLLKTVLLVFAAVLGAQGFSMAVKGVLHLAGYPLPQGSDSKESAA